MIDINTKKVGVVEKIGYGLGDTASNLIFQTVILLMPFFYTNIFGISAAAMGTLFLLVRVMDAITDPIMGALSDRTNTRWGKFRPYLLWLAIPYGIIAVLAFTTPDLDSAGKLIYAYITYGLLMIVYTAINIPYCALGGVLSSSSTERISINSFRFFLSTGGGLIVALFTLPLVALLGEGDDQKGYQLAMVIFSCLAVILFFISFKTTRERVVQAKDKSTSSSFWQDIKILFTNDQWRIVALLNFILLVAVVLRGASAIYYLTWFAQRADLISAFLATGMAASMLGASLASKVTQILSVVKAYVLIQGSVVLSSLALYFVGSNDIVLMFVFFGFAQFFIQMSSPILWTMMADTVDYGELKTGRRITGLVFSGALFFLKMGMAIGGALLGWILAASGYQGEATEQSHQAITSIVLLFTILPAFGHLLLMLIVPKYKLDQKRCAQIRIELEQPQHCSTA